MDRNNHPRTRQDTRRGRNKKTFPKKLGLGVITFVSLCLICGGVYATYAIQHKPEQDDTAADNERYEQKEAALLENIRTSQKQENIESTEHENTDGNIQTLLYEPVSSDAIPQLPELKTELTTLIETNKKIQPKETQIKIVGQIAKLQLNQQILGYQAKLETYTWDQKKDNWAEKTETGKLISYVNETTNQPLKLVDLFTDDANFLAVKQVIQQKLLDESSDGNAVIDQVLNMPNLPLDTTTFTYYSDKITLTLPENIAGKTEITLPYKDIAGYINAELIDPDSVKDALPEPLDPNKKYISLTFDDGPNPETTPRLLDILKEKGVKATFFMLGQNVVKHEALAKRVAEEGHEVASHSYSHPQLTNIDAQRVKDEVQKTDKAIYRATGKLPTDFRPPYGAVNKDVAAIIGKPIIQWSVDSQDWQSHNADAIIKRINDTAYNDTIVLMHDIHPDTVDAVPRVIDCLREEGYEILPSRELLGKKAKPLHMYYGSKDERLVQ